MINQQQVDVFVVQSECVREFCWGSLSHRRQTAKLDFPYGVLAYFPALNFPSSKIVIH